MISITENAIDHISKSVLTRGKGLGVRVGLKTSGCSGFRYTLEYTDSILEDDITYECGDYKLVVSPKELPYLDGMELDYVKKGLNEGFDFKNPNARSACGCGESFTVDE